MAAPRFLILADGDFGPMTSKTANSVIRYLPERTVGSARPVPGGKDRPGNPRVRRRDPRGRVDEGRAGAGTDCRLDRDRAAGWSPARRVAHLAGGSARRGLRPLERPAHLSGRRPGAGGKGEVGRATDLRSSAATLGSSRRLRGSQDRRSVRRSHGGNRLQRGKDDGAASAGPRSSMPPAFAPALSPPGRPAS